MDNSIADLNTLKLYCNDEISRFFSEENIEEQERKAEEEFVTLLAQLQLEDAGGCGKKKRRRIENTIDFWETQWGQLISHPNKNNPRAKEGKTFRRRFRLPFPVFQFLLKQCKDYNVF